MEDNVVSLRGWQTEEDGYSPYKYYSRSVDTNGHSAEVRCKIPPELHSALARLVTKGAIPELDSVADFMRDALMHRVKFLEKHVIKDAKFSEAVNRRLKLTDIEVMAAQREQFREQLENIEAACTDLVRDGDWQGLCEIVNAAASLLDDYRDPYYSRLSTMIQGFSGQVPEGWQSHLD